MTVWNALLRKMATTRTPRAPFFDVLRRSGAHAADEGADTVIGRVVEELGGRRIVGDVAGPFIESGRIRGRVVAVADNSKSFVDYAYRNRRAVYGVIEADLTSTTTLDASSWRCRSG